MFTKEICTIVALNQWQEIEKKEQGIPREIVETVDLRVPHATILSGIRRSGKSTLLKQLMKKVKDYYYCNFEDPRLSGFTLADFERLDAVFQEQWGEKKYYFFDEIQNVSGWERYVRFLLDKGKKCIITGSNASLLSKELGTKLTGRHITYEVFPFSYTEMLVLKQKHAAVDFFEEYLSKGGFPEFLLYENQSLHHGLLADVLWRDVILRYNIREKKIVEQLLLYFITNGGKEFSYNNLAHLFALGSPNSVISYVSYFEDSYLLFTIPMFAYSYKKQVKNHKKVYCIDTGFAAVNTASFSLDKGRMLETAVFLQLRRKHKNIFYFKEKYECDFLIKEYEKVTEAIQVCYTLTEENKEREIQGLKEAMNYTKIKKGYIITMDQQDSVDGISLIPAWKWFSEEDS